MKINKTSSSTIVVLEDEIPNPEDRAMLCALYSRSPASVLEHLKKVDATGSSKFMERFYVGFGHDSVGDLGNVYVFFENVSIVAAACLENFQLFSGQECSTRYINFAEQVGRYSPVLAELYHSTLDRAVKHLTQQVESIDTVGVAPEVVQRAINARAFDYARGMLPSACRTNVAMFTSIRKAREHLTCLLEYPYEEVRELAAAALNSLAESYPSSFSELPKKNRLPSLHFASSDPRYSASWDHITINRAALPRHSSPEFCQVELNCCIDFGSYRDLHRHRTFRHHHASAVMGTRGLHPFYLTYLNEEERGALSNYVEEIFERAESVLPDQRFEFDYELPLATVVEVSGVMSLENWRYMAALRSTPGVHPTLRRVIQQAAFRFNDLWPEHRVAYDSSADPVVYLPRGTHTIIEKPARQL